MVSALRFATVLPACALSAPVAHPNTERLTGALQWRYFCREYDIRSTIHEMRHTYISILKNDMPEQMLKDLVGHSVNMDTYGVYGHVVNGEMERAKNIMDSTFARVLSEQHNG